MTSNKGRLHPMRRCLVILVFLIGCSTEDTPVETCTAYQTQCVGNDVYVCQPDGTVTLAKACEAWQPCSAGECVGDKPKADSNTAEDVFQEPDLPPAEDIAEVPDTADIPEPDDTESPTDLPPEDDSVEPEDSADPPEVWTPPENPELVTLEAWVPSPHPDGFWTDDPEHVVCDPVEGFGVENYKPVMDKDLFVVDTLFCNYATVQ